MRESAPTLLELRNLSVTFTKGKTRIRAVDNASLSIRTGETVALVGESGSGKSVTSLAIMRLLPTAQIGGEIRWHEGAAAVDLLGLPETRMRAMRGGSISMIFQEPMTSLNPVHRIGDQVAEAARLHRSISRREARALAEESLRMVGIPDARRRLDAMPHEMSGGMRQRVMIAMSLVCRPALLIADEPTTALDVTIQAQILDLLRRLQSELQMSMLFITHDFGVVAEIAERVAVMYAGQIVEQGETDAVLSAPAHPYTRALLASIPKLTGRSGRLPAIGGIPPDLTKPATGCRFAARCRAVEADLCTTRPIELIGAGEARAVRCARWRDIAEMADA